MANRLYTDADARLAVRPTNKGVLVIGGDHPYAQWAGNGQGALYANNGLRPYLAINTDTTGRNNLDPGNTDMLSWAQVAAMSPAVDLVAHGARHIQGWSRINTGFILTYAGSNGTATASVSATQLVGTAGADSFALTLASYTLATLQTAVQAVPGWTLALAPELTGDEPASVALQVGAYNVKTTGARFAVGGGIWVLYNGTAYRDVMVQVQSSTLKIYADGVRVGSISLSGGVLLSAVVTAINALGVSGLSATLCDNLKSSSASFESFVTGQELAINLSTLSPGKSCMAHPLVLNAGLPHWYMVERQLRRCKDQGAANGVTFKSFSNSGAEFLSTYLGGHCFSSARGNDWNSIDTTTITVCSIPAHLARHWRPVVAITATNYTQARTQALWRALQNSPGHLVDVLMHKVLADGSSGYSFPTTDVSYYDQTETAWVAAVQDVGARVRSGLITNIQPVDVEGYSAAAQRPANYLFNPTFENSGESLIVSPLADRIIPGWALLANPADFSAVSIGADSAFAATMLTASERNPLRQSVLLPPGQYEVGALVEVIGYVSGNGVSLQMNSFRGVLPDGWLLQQTNTFRSRFVTGRMDHVAFRFSVPAPPSFGKARIISGAFGAGVNMSINKNIRLNVFARGAFDIDCSAGAASAASVQAHEASAAINSAIKAQGYPAELFSLARAENGRVILEVPKRGPDGTFVMTVADGSSLSITPTMFGNSDCFAWARAADFDSFAVPVEFRALAALSSGARFRITSPYITEVTSQ